MDIFKLCFVCSHFYSYPMRAHGNGLLSCSNNFSHRPKTGASRPTPESLKLIITKKIVTWDDTVSVQWHKTPTHDLKILSSILIIREEAMCLYLSLFSIIILDIRRKKGSLQMQISCTCPVTTAGQHVGHHSLCFFIFPPLYPLWFLH